MKALPKRLSDDSGGGSARSTAVFSSGFSQSGGQNQLCRCLAGGLHTSRSPADRTAEQYVPRSAPTGYAIDAIRENIRIRSAPKGLI